MVSLQVAFAALALSGVGQTVMLDFYSDSCGPCRAMAPTVDALIAKGYPVQRINRDKNPELAAKFGAQRIPCFVMIVDGQEVDRVVGGTTYSRLERMCKIQAPPLSPPASDDARRKQTAGRATGDLQRAGLAGISRCTRKHAAMVHSVCRPAAASGQRIF